MTIDSPERVSSRMEPNYYTFENCFFMSIHWMFNGSEFLNFMLAAKQN